ncbi:MULTISPECIES: hypothetical protein [Zobellia]|uniref:Uncharacterized protein n=1 Tax=Zobellia galactanivorans (strain DSM 12802 / CCUG 47099 / CIP 106680 / NCIMB 13871 / Dsij) TaxID=63186 RepID=G0L0J8_ZOBGA|nr:MULTISPECIES: hypothetical protein [Zobellia]MBU3024711.1 hypothetical protein [Zobellia galactanivorans]OWW23338.1 hypothetical protein B4Q04_21080 [Zobellia sp. OII3]CAZ97469.1 Conserved hypothetical protein [Zobellia galactanivorans]
MKLFYTNYGTDKSINSDNPIETNAEDAINIFLELVDEDESFIGFVDKNDKSIQFINEKEKWLLDIPNPPHFENLQAYVNDKECISLIEKIIDENKISLDMKLYKVKIMNETLNDILLQEQNNKRGESKKAKPFWKFW